MESLHQCAWSAWEKHFLRFAHGALELPGKRCHQKPQIKQTDGAVTRVSQCIGTLPHVLDHFDHENLVDSGSSKYQQRIYLLLWRSSVQEGSRHQHYPQAKELLESISQEELLEWMMQRSVTLNSHNLAVITVSVLLCYIIHTFDMLMFTSLNYVTSCN